MKSIWNSIPVSTKKISDFGLVIFFVVGVIIPVFMVYKSGWESGSNELYFTGGSFAFFLFCRFLPSLMAPVYKAWMMLAFGMGFVMTRVIISLVYLLLMTPIGVFRRIKGNEVSRSFFDFNKKGMESYWILRDTEYKKEDTEKQY